MTPFTTLSQAVEAQLTALPVMAGVALVQEDSGEIETEIARAENETGMVVLLGIPGFDNEDARLANVVNAKIHFEILVREVPAAWRLASNANSVHCSDLGQAIAPALQGLAVTGFEPLRVLKGEPLGNFTRKPGEGNGVTVFQDYLLQIETMQIFDAS